MENGEIIYREIISEEAGIWYISDITGSKILMKMPSTSIKAAINKCNLQLLFGKEVRNNINYLHTGFNIFDFTQNPLSVIQVCKHDFEQKALSKIFELDEIYIEFFNELDICIAKSFMVLNQEDRGNIIGFIDIDNPYYASYDLNSDEAELSLNNIR